MRTLALLLCLVGVALGLPQFEKGHVRILSDQRYQDGARFGNYRDQEDGIKYQEETDANGVRTGFWEYRDETTGQTLRTTFRAGAGIGFQILSSDLVAPTVLPAQPTVHQASTVPQTAVRSHPQPAARPVIRKPVTQAPVFVPTTTTPHPNIANLFDYPGNLDFNQTPQGHRFKFTATR